MSEYKGSICCATVNASTLEQLKIRLIYHKLALDFWETAENKEETEFFKESVLHVEERIKQLSK